MKNLLIKSENVYALNYLINELGLRGKVDLVYIDPPFATNINFTVTNGRTATISNSKNGEVAYSDKLLGKDFIEFLRERLILLKELLSEQGSIYLHTDYKIGHYVKVMMDEVFGIENFRNDITRIKCNPKNFKRIGYGNIKDMILFYTKGDNPIWNEPFTPYTKEDIERLFPKTDSKGRRYTTVPLHAPGETLNTQPFKGLMPPPGRHWRTDVKIMEELDRDGLIEWSDNGNPRKIIYLDSREGKRLQDVWNDWKDPQYPVYPTEKNLDLIQKIICTSSNPGSIVLDCFCGSGTTLEAAARCDRAWIGIDQSDLAIQTSSKRMRMEDKSFFGVEAELLDFSDRQLYTSLNDSLKKHNTIVAEETQRGSYMVS